LVGSCASFAAAVAAVVHAFYVAASAALTVVSRASSFVIQVVTWSVFGIFLSAAKIA